MGRAGRGRAVRAGAGAPGGGRPRRPTTPTTAALLVLAAGCGSGEPTAAPPSSSTTATTTTRAIPTTTTAKRVPGALADEWDKKFKAARDSNTTAPCSPAQARTAACADYLTAQV